MKKRGVTARFMALALGAIVALAPAVAGAWHSAIARTANLVSLHMVSATTGWALEANSILYTSNGGDRWDNVTPRGAIVSRVSQADFTDARTAWVTASRQRHVAPLLAQVVLLHTTNSGRTWQFLPLNLPATIVGVKQIDFLDARHGWLYLSLGAAAGSEGVQILRTTDGGAHWSSVSRTASSQPAPGSLPLSGDKSGLGFNTTATGMATGEIAGPTGFSWLYRTRDGGHTWRHQSLAFPALYRQSLPVINPPLFFTPRDGILPVTLNAAGFAFDAYMTHDGGATWIGATPLPYNPKMTSLSWSFSDMIHGWAAWGARLHVTTDGGRHWRAVTPNVSLQNVIQLDFVNARDGWALGSVMQGNATQSFLLRTTDGGHTWTRLSPYVVFPSYGGIHPMEAGWP